MTRRIYLDLDGVMADFDGSFPAVFGLDHRSLADDAMWLHINGHPSFFRDLPPMAGAVEFFRSIEHLDPIILTACPKSNYAHVATQKVEWVRTHLSAHVTVLPVLGGSSKPLFMHAKGDILIDDFRRNTEAWAAAGGHAILHRGFDGTAAALAEAIGSYERQTAQPVEAVDGNVSAPSEEVRLALQYSRNYAEASPYMTQTGKEHILGLCTLVEKMHAALAHPRRTGDAVAELIEAARDVDRRAGPDREPRLRAALAGLSPTVEQAGEVVALRIVGRNGPYGWHDASEMDKENPPEMIVGEGERVEYAYAQSRAVGVPDGPLTGKYADVLVPFVALMERELHANAGKGDRPGWLGMTRTVAVLEIHHHVAKLQKAVLNGDIAGVREYAADVANMSMMAVDVCGALIETAPAPAKAGEV